MSMTIKQRDIILLFVLLIALIGFLYYYLFYTKYQEEKALLIENTQNLYQQMAGYSVFLTNKEALLTEIASAKTYVDFGIPAQVDTGVMLYYVANVINSYSKTSTFGFDEPTFLENDEAIVSVPVTFTCKQGELLTVLEYLEKIPLANRVNNGSITVTDPKETEEDSEIAPEDWGNIELSVSLNIEFYCQGYEPNPNRDYPYSIELEKNGMLFGVS